MPLKLMYITNSPRIAQIAEKSGVDWIFVDLEVLGKEERQGHLDTVISRHSREDVRQVRQVLKKSELLVRVNPINENSKEEITGVIKDGADIVMLPFFNTKGEVKTFIEFVGGKAKTCLLLETPAAVDNIESILEVEGVDYIHIGLNDLHLGYGMRFMFELLADGTVERLCRKIQTKGIPYGFGGVARIGEGTLSAECIIAEHYRLKSSMAILSRSFCNVSQIKDYDRIARIFHEGVSEIRHYETKLLQSDNIFFAKNSKLVCKKVAEIISALEINSLGRGSIE